MELRNEWVDVKAWNNAWLNLISEVKGMTNKFKPGDIVQLKCGGPRMLIKQVSHKSYRSWDCIWHLTDGSLVGQTVSEEFLVDCSQEANDKCARWLERAKIKHGVNGYV